MRQFYLTFPNSYALRSELSWTHYHSLMRVENEKAWKTLTSSNCLHLRGYFHGEKEKNNKKSKKNRKKQKILLTHGAFGGILDKELALGRREC